VIVSLREPVNRCASAFANKIADKTVRKHLDEHLYHGRVDKRKDDEVAGYRVPSLRDLAVRVNRTLAVCPDYSWHHTLAERPPRVAHPSGDCYVNPFVLHGA
jgi:hypothetical protein